MKRTLILTTALLFSTFALAQRGGYAGGSFGGGSFSGGRTSSESSNPSGSYNRGTSSSGNSTVHTSNPTGGGSGNASSRQSIGVTHGSAGAVHAANVNAANADYAGRNRSDETAWHRPGAPGAPIQRASITGPELLKDVRVSKTRLDQPGFVKPPVDCGQYPDVWYCRYHYQQYLANQEHLCPDGSPAVYVGWPYQATCGFAFRTQIMDRCNGSTWKLENDQLQLGAAQVRAQTACSADPAGAECSDAQRQVSGMLKLLEDDRSTLQSCRVFLGY